MAHKKLNTFHLFAGAGGGILADLLLGHNPVGACEIEPYPRNVLLARQRDGILPSFPIWDDICTLDGKPWRGLVDVVCGGFPCQDISAAGKGAGIAGERSGLWGEMARVICEIRPRFAFVENSPMLTSRGLHRVLGDLAEMGYDARWCVLGACDAGAPHKRDRIWILGELANTEGERREGATVAHESSQGQQSAEGGCCEVVDSEGGEDKRRKRGVLDEKERGRQSSDSTAHIGGEDEDLADFSSLGSAAGFSRSESREDGNPDEPYDRSDFAGWWAIDPAEMGDTVQGRLSESESESVQERSEDRTGERSRATSASWRPTEPLVGRVAHGVACRVDRLKAIGNGQVPQCAAMAFNILTQGISNPL